MDFGTIFFGGLSLLAYLKNKKKTTTESTSNDVVKENVDNNIQFVSDSEYNEWLNDKLKTEYEAEKAEREAEEAAAKAEEERLRKLGNVAFDYNLNNYTENLKDVIFNDIPSDFYNFTDPASLLKIGIDQNGNWSNAGLQLIEMCRFRIFPDKIYTYTNLKDIIYFDTAVFFKKFLLAGSYYTLVCDLEIVNPTDRMIKFINKIDISKLEISGIELTPYTLDVPLEKAPKVTSAEDAWKSGMYVAKMYAEKIGGDLIVNPKSNAFFTVAIGNLYSKNKITEDTTNFSFALNCNLFQDLGQGQKSGLHCEFRSFMGDQPEIISSENDSYLKQRKVIRYEVKTREELKDIYE